MRLVLASASPRRADLLRAAGFVFETLVVDLDERVQPGETPAGYVRRLAMEKSARALEVLAGLTTCATSGQEVLAGLKTCATSGEGGVAQDFSPALAATVVL